ncbi:secreted antigen 1 [Babesia divergens]|uniref:Secreted antigen 1 n=1 Tax=Babesia divergens TaxID=32595 RepID=A0AAD9GH20_BABDI|nr:secreted antigen 1 [Babesia divergens]
MKLLGILRVSALCLLVSAFHGQSASCGLFKSNKKSKEPSTVEVHDIAENHEDSTVKSQVAENLKDSTVESPLVEKPSQESSSASSVPAPKSNLVFENSTWDVSQLASSNLFIRQFCKEVKGYKFSGKISAGNIRKLDKACWWVSFYVDSFRWRRVRGLDENPYEDALKPEKFKDYAEWIVKYIPEIKKSMRNMYNESIGLTEKQRETATSSGPYKYGFVHNDNWWKAVGSQFVLDSFGMAPSFLQSLKDLKSSLEDILNGPKEFTVESKPSVPAPKSNLVFENSEWDDSMLASTFLFINEFCKGVNAKKFNEKISNDIYEDLSEKCEYVSSYMGSFIHRFKPTYGPGSVTERKEIPMNFYKDVLKAEDFDVYAKWIVKNIPVIRVSLKHMYYESIKLSEEQLNEFSSYGPRKYGFVYTGYDWGELTHGVSRGFFKDSTILQSFKDLRSSLEKVLKSFPKDSTV